MFDFWAHAPSNRHTQSLGESGALRCNRWGCAPCDWTRGMVPQQLQGRRSDLVGNCLAFGAILLSVPLAVATWIHRYQDDFVWHDELGFLFVSILLLATGLMLQLRATTLVGGFMSAVYLCTFAILVPWQKVDMLATAILSGGAVLFGVGALLAFYREQILALPEAIQRRRGVFRVLDWR